MTSSSPLCDCEFAMVGAEGALVVVQVVVGVVGAGEVVEGWRG